MRTMRKAMRSFAFATFALAAAVACSSSTSSGGGGATDAGPGSDAGAAGDGRGGGQEVNGCTPSSYEDHTAASDPRAITFPMTDPAPYQPPCMHIKVGQSVTWTGGNFAAHPLEPHGGDTPTPINIVADGTTPVAIPFPTAGTFGFECAEHPTTMHGAIFVSP